MSVSPSRSGQLHHHRPGRGWAGRLADERGSAGFGSVRRLSSGRWQVRYRTTAGCQHTGPETFASKADAARYLAKVETDLHRGAWSDPGWAGSTFAEWAARWEATTVNLRANTRATYRNLLRRYLLPTFGGAAWPTSTRWPSGRGWRSWNARGWGRARGPSPTGCCRASWARPSRAGYLARNPCTIEGPPPSAPPRCGSPPWPRSPPWPTPSAPLSGAGPGRRLRWAALGGAGRPAGQAGGPAAWPDHGGRAAP